MLRRRFSLIIVLLLITNVVSAETLGRVMKGQIVTDDTAGLRVMLKDSDGVILDMSDTTEGGVYQLDLTIMDKSSQAAVKTLSLEIRDKKGIRATVQVSDYLKSFDATVFLNPIEIK